MKCSVYGLVIVLLCGFILETSARSASQAIQVRRRRNRNNQGQRKIYIARQAAPVQQQQQNTEVFEEELPTALTETDFNEPNKRISNVQDNQRFIGTGFGSFFTNKQTLLGLLASTTTTTSTTTAAPVTFTGVGTITLTPVPAADTPQNDPIAPSQPAAAPFQRRQQVYYQPVGASGYGPVVIRRGAGGFAGLRPFGSSNGFGGQAIRVPIPIRLTRG